MREVLKWIAALVESLPHAFYIAAAKLHLIHRYQPIFGDDTNAPGERDCHDRWTAVEKYLPNEPFSFLDIGSQMGYFTCSAAKRGALALGVERVPQYAKLARAIQHKNRIRNAAFIEFEINPQSVSALPKFDVVWCTSVYHHWVLDWGMDSANNILTSLIERAEVVIFETGQPDEVDQAFSKSLAFMGSNYEGWIKDFFTARNFKSITIVGKFPTHLGPTPRTLFVAKRSREVGQ